MLLNDSRQSRNLGSGFHYRQVLSQQPSMSKPRLAVRAVHGHLYHAIVARMDAGRADGAKDLPCVQPIGGWCLCGLESSVPGAHTVVES